MSRWLQEKATQVLSRNTNRRSFLVKSALVGSAVAANPLEYVLTPTSAYAAICSCANAGCDCGSACCDGWTEFCCTITGANSCPAGTVPGGWWKADANSYCGGNARYYIDCNVAPGYNPCSCGCAGGDCNNRRSCCTQFRYGQCHQEFATVGPIMCRVVSCTPPWILDPTCTTTPLTDNRTGAHNSACLQTPPPPVITKSGIGLAREGVWFLRSTATTGPAEATFFYGASTDVPVTGDFAGTGHDGVGTFRGGYWFLRRTANTGPAEFTFPFGTPSDIPVVGDWNGTGHDGVGVFRGGYWFLRNSATTGPAEHVFAFGLPGDIPVVGDWNGTGRDGIGVVRNGQWFLRNTASGGTADRIFFFGNPSDTPVVGDWSGTGSDGIGVMRDGLWFLRNTATTGPSERTFFFGSTNDTPLVGKW